MQEDLSEAMAGLGIAGPSRQRAVPARASTPIATPELREVIRTLITDTLQGGHVIRQALGVEAEEPLTDIPYVSPTQNSELEKVPDVTRLIKEFSGDRTSFGSWKKNVDRIMAMFAGQELTHKYYLVTLAVRMKVVGEAETVLESYNTPLNWKAISKCLTEHYADKRDLKTLEYQLFSLTQGRLSIMEFYQAVYHQLSLILNQVSVQEDSADSIRALTNSYRGKALDTFVRGLNGDLPRLLAVKEPRDLSHALHLCNLLDNQDHRNAFLPKGRLAPPPVPPRQFANQTYAKPTAIKPMHNNNQSQWRNFDPRLYYAPRPANQVYQPNPNQARNLSQPPQRQMIPQQQFQYRPLYSAPPRPLASKPEPKPIPMEVDGSIHSARVNYMNRPQQNYNAGKRPPPLSGPPQKFQRQFHINTGDPTEEYTEEQAYFDYLTEQELNADASAYNSGEQEYYACMESAGFSDTYDDMDQIGHDPEIGTTDLSDVNFLV